MPTLQAVQEAGLLRVVECITANAILGLIMIAYVLYNKDTAAERQANELVDRLKREQLEVELIDADSARGIQLVESYDILGRPAVILVKSDGAPLKIWQGDDGLPVPTEVAYLARQ